MMTMKEKTSKGGVAPAITLMILAPLIAEVLSGATRLSFIFAFVPEILVWGGGALLIRELVRRWGGGWVSLLLLGIGLAVAEETVIQQTSLAPLPWLVNIPVYGRVWGVNWPYFLFMLGYESVLVVMAPVQLTELIFPEKRKQPWLSGRGLAIVSVVFVLGSFIAWAAWTQRARPMVFHVAKYVPPPFAIGLGVLAIVLLAVAAYATRNVGGESVKRAGKVSALLVGLGTLILGFPWYVLITLVFAPRPSLPLWIPMLGGVAWAGLAFLIVKRWTSSAGWGDIQRWAMAGSAVLVSMVAGFGGSSVWPRMDLIGKGVMNVVAVALLAMLGMSIFRRGQQGIADLPDR
jgi:hypothetical protein